jgi:GntR family transcriptional regulator
MFGFIVYRPAQSSGANKAPFVRSLVPDVPIHAQIRNHLQAAIAEGILKPQERIPSEKALTEMYGVSRMTARQALSALVERGLVYKVQGRGTFVAQQKIDRDLVGLRSLYEELETRGMRVGTKLLSAEVQKADEPTATALEVEPDAPVFILRRLRLADGEPIALHVNTIPVEVCPDLLEDTGGEMDSLYHYLEEQGIVLNRGVQRLEAMAADTQLARLLGVRPKAPILFQERITLGVDNRPIEMSLAYYRGDRYSCHVELQR